MARLAPAACSPCAIAHAIERLLATPKTTAVRPFKSSNMNGSLLGKKNNSILVSVGRTLLSAAFVLGVDLDRQNQLQNRRQRQLTRVSAPHKPIVSLLRDRRHHLLCFHRPAGAAKSNRINGSDHAKP